MDEFTCRWNMKPITDPSVSLYLAISFSLSLSLSLSARPPPCTCTCMQSVRPTKHLILLRFLRQGARAALSLSLSRPCLRGFMGRPCVQTDWASEIARAWVQSGDVIVFHSCPVPISVPGAGTRSPAWTLVVNCFCSETGACKPTIP